MKEQKLNIWKWLFLGLVSVVFAGGLVIYGRLSTVREDTRQQQTDNRKSEKKIGTLSFTREEVNETIAIFLKKYQLTTDYQVTVDSRQVLLRGKLKLLGSDFAFYLYLQPSKDEKGNLRLQVKDVSVGTFEIPKKMVLQEIAKNKHLPKFVNVLPKEEAVTLDLSALENDLGIIAKINTIDLYQDQIIVDLYRQ